MMSVYFASKFQVLSHFTNAPFHPIMALDRHWYSAAEAEGLDSGHYPQHQCGEAAEASRSQQP